MEGAGEGKDNMEGAGGGKHNMEGEGGGKIERLDQPDLP